MERVARCPVCEKQHLTTDHTSDWCKRCTAETLAEQELEASNTKIKPQVFQL